MKTIKVLSAIFSFVLLIIIMDFWSLDPSMELPFIYKFAIIGCLSFLPWHWYRRIYDNKKFDHFLVCFLIIGLISFSGRFYLGLNGMKQWRYPLAQIFPSLSPVLANDIALPTILNLMDVTMGVSTSFIINTGINAFTVLNAKHKLKDKNKIKRWCQYPTAKECAFEMNKHSLEATTIDNTSIILWIAVLAKETMHEKKESLTVTTEKDKRIQILVRAILDLAKASHLGLMKTNKLYPKINRLPASTDFFETGQDRLRNGFEEVKESKDLSIGLLRIIDNDIIHLRNYINDFTNEEELLTLVNEIIAKKFTIVATTRTKKMLLNIKDKIKPEDKKEFQIYADYFQIKN